MEWNKIDSHADLPPEDQYVVLAEINNDNMIVWAAVGAYGNDSVWGEAFWDYDGNSISSIEEVSHWCELRSPADIKEESN